MSKFISKIGKKISTEFGRSILFNTLCKSLGMIISFLYTPVLLNYLGDESYGIWATILSIINWINYFDIGIGNGLRNRLTKHVNANDKQSAQYAVSTAYVILSAISGIMIIIGSVIIAFVNDQQLFRTTINVKPVLYVSFIFICINFVLALSKVQLFAIQRAEKAGFMTVLIQAFNLIGVVVLSLISKGNILAVAILVGISGIAVNIMFSINVWKKHKEFIPHIKSFRKVEIASIGNLGIKFFIIQMAALVLYTTDNIIITQLFGPSFVTPYQTAYTAFGLVNGLFAAIMVPLWSKYTVAVENGNYKWIKNVIIKLDLMLIPISLILGIGVFAFKPLSIIWLHKELDYSSGLITCMGIYYFLFIWGSIYSTVMNGIGKVNLQIVLAVLSAIINIPLSIYLGKQVGLNSTGVLLATIICMLFTNTLVTYNIHRYLNKKINKVG